MLRKYVLLPQRTRLHNVRYASTHKEHAPGHEHHSHKSMPLQCWSCTKFVDKEEPEPQEDLFKLFKLPKQFELDTQKLAERFKSMQLKLHPDKFAMKSKTEQAFSEDQTATLNHAYNVLKTPHLRAEYLLGLNGVDVGESMGTLTDTALLMEIMELREAVDEGSQEMLKELGAANRKKLESMSEELAKIFSAGDYAKAKTKTIELKYLEKIQEEIIHKIGEHV